MFITRKHENATKIVPIFLNRTYLIEFSVWKRLIKLGLPNFNQVVVWSILRFPFWMKMEKR